MSLDQDGFPKRKRRKTSDVDVLLPKEKDTNITLLDNLLASSFDEKAVGVKAKKVRSAKEVEREKIAEIRNRHHISVIGTKVPPPEETFEGFKENLKLSAVVCKNLISSGYDAPTAIQMQAIPLLLQVIFYTSINWLIIYYKLPYLTFIYICIYILF